MHANIKTIEKVLEAIQKEVVNEDESTSKDVKIMLNYIREHLFDDSLTIAKMKRDLRISNGSYAGKFKLYIGQYPKEYILEKRCKAGKELLQKTDLFIAQISIVIGFSSHSAFCKTFKSTIRMTPSKWYEQNSDQHSK